MDKSVLRLSRQLPVLSLEKLAFIRTSSNLCNNPRLLTSITRLRSFWPRSHYTSYGKDWNNIQAQASRLIPRSEMSSQLREKIMEMLWPLCYKIMLWKFKYAPSIGGKFLRHFYWTDHGRIDHIRTMESLVKNRSISLRRRFILACSMSLINEMVEMWKEMSDVDKKYFCRPNKQKICPLLLFWAHTFEQSHNVLDDYMRNALICSIENGLFEGIKGLINICSLSERKDMALFCLEEFLERKIRRFYLEEDDIDIGFFLFSEMSEENQTTIFNTKSDFVFGLLVHSSDDRYFKNLLGERLHFDPEFLMVAPIYVIYDNIHLEVNQDYDYCSLFIEVWRKLPVSNKLFLKETGLGEHIMATVIKDNFLCVFAPYAVVPKLLSISKGKLIYRNRKSRLPVGFNHRKWKFLHLIVLEEIATLASLTENRGHFFVDLEEIIYDKNILWKNVLRFVRRIESISKRNHN